MEYLDYQTGKPISREQYIKNGIERGELKVTQPCGCVVIEDRTAGAYIVYCHKHKAAPDMYVALQQAKQVMEISEVAHAMELQCGKEPYLKVAQALSTAKGV